MDKLGKKLKENERFINISTEKYDLEIPIFKAHSLDRVDATSDELIKALFTFNTNLCQSLTYLTTTLLNLSSKSYYKVIKECNHLKIYLPHLGDDFFLNTSVQEIKRVSSSDFAFYLTSLCVNFISEENEAILIEELLDDWYMYYQSELNNYKEIFKF